MIRRNPTLISLEDADVSDIKEFMTKKKLVLAEEGTKDTKNDDKTLKMPFVAAEDAKRKREAMTKEDRIGTR